jgi:hypothetical protein
MKSIAIPLTYDNEKRERQIVGHFEHRTAFEGHESFLPRLEVDVLPITA